MTIEHLEVPSSYFLTVGQSWELKESWMPVFKLTGFPCWRRDARSQIETKTPGHLHWCHCKLCCLSSITWACLATHNLKLLESPLQRALWIMVGTISSLCLRMEILSELHWLQAAACHASRNVPPLSAKASGLQDTWLAGSGALVLRLKHCKAQVEAAGKTEGRLFMFLYLITHRLR